MFFKSPAHRARFLSAIRQSDKIDHGKIDPEYGAALYILTADSATFEKAKPYISRDGILFAKMLRQTDFSSGHRVLVQLAGNLFNGQTKVSPVDFTILDIDNFNVMQEALRTRCTPPYLGEIVEAEN